MGGDGHSSGSGGERSRRQAGNTTHQVTCSLFSFPKEIWQMLVNSST